MDTPNAKPDNRQSEELGSVERADALSLGETAFFDDAVHKEVPDFIEAHSDVEYFTRIRLVEQIGRGGMGVVFRGWDTTLERCVAVKVLRWDIEPSERMNKRFMDEAMIMARLQHPGVLPIYGSGHLNDGRPFYIMKLHEGESLADCMRATSTENRLRLVDMFAQVCQTMAYAHSMGIAHLDLKPANILIGDYGKTRIIDWGLAKQVQPVGEATAHGNSSDVEPLRNCSEEHSGITHGTPAYMSPEQANGKVVGFQTDVFALGAILCEILTERPVYVASDNINLVKKAMRGATHRAIYHLRETQAEKWLVELIEWCLQPDPADRPQDAGEVTARLARLLEEPLEQFERDMVRFFELSPDLFCIADLDGFFRRVNSNFTQVLGYSEQALLSQPFLNFVLEEDREMTLDVLGGLRDGKEVRGFRNRYETSSKELLTLEWTAKTAMDEGLVYAVARVVS